jgi:hypothetical protein
MLILAATTDSLQVFPGSASALHVVAAFYDSVAGSVTEGAQQASVTTGSAETEILAAPAASTKRLVKSVSICSRAATQTVEVRLRYGAGGTDWRELQRAVLGVGETLHYEDGRGWYVGTGPAQTVRTGRKAVLWKPGTGADTVGYWYCHARDAGTPGAWAPGTPGLAGRATDGTAVADAGCLPLVNPAAGQGNFLTSMELAGTVAHLYWLVDILWVNSGLVVTTTTGQTINSVALPARDANGTTNGEGCLIGLLFTAASTNAAVINNSTVTYTNSANVAARTATLANLVGAQIPATPVAGTVVWYQLAAGDTGVKSIQSIALGTSLLTGSVSLIIARVLDAAPALVANVGSPRLGERDPGVRLWNGTCAHLCYVASATTATTTAAAVTVQERSI